jgi:tetrahydromethanopterin S-methyltransferase subunit G
MLERSSFCKFLLRLVGEPERMAGMEKRDIGLIMLGVLIGAILMALYGMLLRMG